MSADWAYDGDNVDVGMETWKKAGIGIDAVLALGLLALEVLVIRGYKETKRRIKEMWGGRDET